MPQLSDFTGITTGFHWVAFLLLFVDFCVTGVPVRLIHFIQPLGFALLYNSALVISTYVTRHQGPFYRVADYFSRDAYVSYVIVGAEMHCRRLYTFRRRLKAELFSRTYGVSINI